MSQKFEKIKKKYVTNIFKRSLIKLTDLEAIIKPLTALIKYS